MKLLLSVLMFFQSIFALQEKVVEIDKILNEVDVPIVMYHHIEENEDILNDFMVTPKKLENDIKKIKDMGYVPVSYIELYDFVNNGGTLPDKPILITFDDGYESNYTYLYPLLKRYDMKATISVIGKMVGKDTCDGIPTYKHFTYDEAKEMYNSGLVEIQTHTYSLHDINNRVGIKIKDGENEETYKELVANDITKSVAELTNEVGSEKLVFTYPYGAYNDLTESILKDLGFEITVTTDSGINHIKLGEKDTLLKLKRYNITNNTELEKILGEIHE